MNGTRESTVGSRRQKPALHRRYNNPTEFCCCFRCHGTSGQTTKSRRVKGCRVIHASCEQSGRLGSMETMAEIDIDGAEKNHE